LNRIWGVRPKPGFRLGEWLQRRGMTYLMVLLLGLLLTGSLVLNAVLRYLLPAAPGWAPVVNLVVGFALLSAFFACLYRFLPDTIISWGDVCVGAILTALLVTAGRQGIGIYFRYSTVASAYGAAGSFVLLLIMFYYSASMVYFGAELTRAYAAIYGHAIIPRSYAERIKGTGPELQPAK
jgi:membrane protein